MKKLVLSIFILAAALNLFAKQASDTMQSERRHTSQAGGTSGSPRPIASLSGAPADTLPTRPTFEQRIFRPLQGHSAYDHLYNRFWANDTVQYKAPNRNKTAWLILPALSYAQETHLNAQLVSLYSFYTRPKDTIERNSTIYTTLAYSQLHQFRIHLRPNIWTAGNLWHLIVDLNYQNANYKFYGTGNHTVLASEELLKQIYTQADFEAEHLLAPHVYGGLDVVYQGFRTFSTGTKNGLFETTRLSQQNNGYAGFGGATFIYDNRDNQNYTLHGSYLRLNAGFAPGFLSATGAMQQYNAELRHFISLTKKTVLGFNVLFNSNTGKTVPFYFLNQLGSDQIMRGYYQGRFRDRDLLAAQVEYRYLFFPRFGVAVFAGEGQVFGQSRFAVGQFKPDYGFGGRYVFDMKSRITIRLDYGRGLRPAGEKTISGFYLSLGEAF